MKRLLYRYSIILLLTTVAPVALYAQELDLDSVRAGILSFLNEQRIANGQEEMVYADAIDKAAQDQANYCSEVKQETLVQKDLKKSTASLRVTYFGGIRDGVPQEIVLSEGMMNKGKPATEIEIIEKFKKKLGKTATRKIFLRADLYYCGIGASVDPLTNKIYVCIVMGDINIINNTAAHSKELDKAYKVNPHSAHWWFRRLNCRISCLFGKCDDGTVCGGYADLRDLYSKIDIDKGFYIKDKKLCLREDFKKYFINTEKNLSTLIEDNNDRLLIYIIELSQFPCNTSYNISVGGSQQTGLEIGLRPITLANLKAKGDLVIDKLPEGFSDNFEIGLKVVKYCDEKVKCDVWSFHDKVGRVKAYLHPVAYEALPVVLDTGSTKFTEPFTESKSLSFRIAFEKNKYEYRNEDIAPFIDSLNEPRFNIQNIRITAYSSVEGDSARNADLQNKRAASIVKVLEQQQGAKIRYTVSTGNAWDIFRKQIVLTNWYYLADSTPAAVARRLNRDTVLLRKLEPQLSEQRFATIDLTVAFDLKKLKEDDYWLYRFNKAMERRDYKRALSNQTALVNLYQAGKIDYDKFQGIAIPNEPKFISMLNNKYVFIKNEEERIRKFDELRALAPQNPIIKYNYLAVKLNAIASLSEDRRREELHILASLFSSLNATVIPVSLYHTLASRFYPITHEAHKSKKPEAYSNVKDVSRNSPVIEAVSLADYYAEQKRYDIAGQIILDHFDEVPANDKTLIREYCLRLLYYGRVSGLPEFEKQYLRIFRTLQKSEPQLFCELFNQSRVSFKFFENLHIKKLYCDHCVKD